MSIDGWLVSGVIGWVIRRRSSSNTHSILWGMSTADQLLYSALQGTAMRYAAERRNLDEAIEELRQIADGRNDVLAEPPESLRAPGMPARPLTWAMS
jgi:hypothetical protein